MPMVIHILSLPTLVPDEVIAMLLAEEHYFISFSVNAEELSANSEYYCLLWNSSETVNNAPFTE